MYFFRKLHPLLESAFLAGYIKSVNSLAFRVNDNVERIFLYCELCCELFDYGKWTCPFRRPTNEDALFYRQQASMQTRAPDEGPSGGWPSASETGGQLTSQDAGGKERYDKRLLRTVVEKNDIDDTKSLVATYNMTTNEDERAVLLGWLRKYHERREDCLTQKSVLEYAELVNITPRSKSEEDILKNLICDLCSRISELNFLPPNFATALYKALVHVDPLVCGVAQLVDVARKLLSSLSATPNITRENFSVHRGTFLALRQSFFLLNAVNQNEIKKKEKRELRRSIAEKERTMEFSCNYYPVAFHFQVLRRAVERLKEDTTTRRVPQTEQYAISETCGFEHVFHLLRNLARCNVDPTALGASYEENRGPVVEMSNMSKKPLFDSLWNLMAARLEAAKEETNLDLFESVCNATIENQQKTENGEDLKTLRFGIIEELGMLAIEGSSESTRRETTIMLSNLAVQQAITEGWIDDDDILIALLDVIHEVHKNGLCNEETEEALTALHRYCEGSTRDVMTVWLDGKSIEDKLRDGSPPAAQPEHWDLFMKTSKDVGHNPIGEDLRKTYLRDDFTIVMFCRNDTSSWLLFRF